MIKNVPNLIMLLVPLAFFLQNCTVLQPIDSLSSTSKKGDNNSQLRQDITTHAQRYIGSKYKYAGTTPKGFDCSGFTCYVLQQYDIQLSRSSALQAKEGLKIPLQTSKPGDLIFFSKSGGKQVSHVALVISNTKEGIKVAHSTTSRGVIVENISQSRYWNPKILFARDVIGR